MIDRSRASSIYKYGNLFKRIASSVECVSAHPSVQMLVTELKPRTVLCAMHTRIHVHTRTHTIELSSIHSLMSQQFPLFSFMIFFIPNPTSTYYYNIKKRRDLQYNRQWFVCPSVCRVCLSVCLFVSSFFAIEFSPLVLPLLSDRARTYPRTIKKIIPDGPFLCMML
jgi:hypothetical protein